MAKFNFCVDDKDGHVKGFIEADSKYDAEEILKNDHTTLYSQGCKVVGIGVENIVYKR